MEMSTSSDHEWELNRENIRPLRGGRKVRSINAIFGGAEKISIREAQEKFENDLGAAEKTADPLAICADYISWFEEHFPTGKQSQMCSILTRIINKFGYREEYLNDERMLKMWLKLVDNKTDVVADSLFERAYVAGCCRQLAKFYVRWAEAREELRDISGARKVLQRGRENCAIPLSLLNEAGDALEMRQLRELQGASDSVELEDERIALEPSRIAFGRLAGLGRAKVAPTFRVSSGVSSGFSSNSDQRGSFNVFAETSTPTSNAFHVFQGEQMFDEQSTLIPQDFGDGLARIELSENSKDPTKWKEARLEGIKKTTKPVTAVFEVFDENDYKKKKRERKKRERLMSTLLIVDEISSLEELLANSRI